MEPKGIKSFADEIGRGAVGRCRDERIGRWPPAMNDRRAFRRSADRRTPTRQSKRMRDRDHRAARLRALRIAVSLAGLADPEFNMTREPIVAVYGCGRPSGARDRRASFIDLRECLDAIKLRQIRHSHRADGSAAARRNFSPGERRRRGSLPRGIKGPARIAMTCSRGAGFRPPPRSYVALTAARRVAAARRPEDPAGLGAGRQRRSFFQVQITCERSWRFWPAWVWRSLKCQVVRLLTAKLEDFAPRRKPGVRAGLDGVALRHRRRHRPAPCRQGLLHLRVGLDRFAAFRTGPGKSRLAFLSRLLGGVESRRAQPRPVPTKSARAPRRFRSIHVFEMRDGSMFRDERSL